MILKQYNANFVTYEIDPASYTIGDLQEAVCPPGDHEGTLQTEYDDLNKKTKFILVHFGSTFGTLRLDVKSFYHSLIGFTPFWDYKPTSAFHTNSPGVYSNDKFSLLNTIKKIHVKCNIIDGSVVNGVREPILFSSGLDKKTRFQSVLRIKNNSS